MNFYLLFNYSSKVNDNLKFQEPKWSPLCATFWEFTILQNMKLYDTLENEESL